MKKKFLTALLCVVAALCLCCGLVGCDFGNMGSENGGADGTQTETESTISGKKIEAVGEPQATLDYNEYLGYSIKIKGALKNTGNKNYSYVSISFTLYDESGANSGQAMANMNNLAAGEIWKYEAISLGFFEEKPVRWKCADITCF